ncbi:MAG: hypothetical protein JSS74_05505 [Actinobacteria bacterium]|nr:hypothetical protein [Actinomycetota bacterium]
MAPSLHVVPAVVGMMFHDARDLAAERELALASFDPDGPSIASLAWPGYWRIVRQDPVPEMLLGRWESVRVDVEPWGHGDAGIPARIPRPPSELDASAALDEPD